MQISRTKDSISIDITPEELETVGTSKVKNILASVLPVHVNIINNGCGVNSDVTSTENEDGSTNVKISLSKIASTPPIDPAELLVQIKDCVTSDIWTGGTKLNKAIEGRYGLHSSYGNRR